MRTGRKIILGIILALATLAAAVWWNAGSEERALARTRRELRRQGYKVDLSDFDFSTSPEMQRRAAVFTTISHVQRSMIYQSRELNSLTPLGSDAALVVWREATLPDYGGADLWPALAEHLEDEREDLDEACRAFLSGPLRFNLDARQGLALLIPHVAHLKTGASKLEIRATFELHQQQREAAWTNLLASTRAVTGWEAEPVEVSQASRQATVQTIYEATWQVLQAGGWEDERLAGLQREWESVDFFKDLPATMAFMRASAADMCQRERQEPVRLGLGPGEMIRQPRQAWEVWKDYWRRLQYRRHGTYAFEQAMLLHYRQREDELREAMKCPNWSAMRLTAGAANKAPFATRFGAGSRTQSMLNTKQLGMSFLYQGSSQLGLAATAEARRRILITAIALERFHARHGTYPASLDELSPELLEQPLPDFMDGKPLRYRRTADGHFVLYSVGPDCQDDGGLMEKPGETPARRLPMRAGIRQGTDLVWPRPASASEARAYWLQQLRQKRLQREAEKEANADDVAREEFARRERVKKLLSSAEAGRASIEDKPMWQGKPLPVALQPGKPAGSMLKLDELLTLRKITPGMEPEIAAFELPIQYEVATNIGKLRLAVDGVPENADSIIDGPGGAVQECVRGTNGYVWLAWNTAYDPPGLHTVQAQIYSHEAGQDFDIELGPVLACASTNLCQFDPFYATYDAGGGYMYAKLAESNGVYKIELKTPSGEPVRTFDGRTTNGIVKVFWDATDERGNEYTNGVVDTFYTITLPDSGRTQRLRGP